MHTLNSPQRKILAYCHHPRRAESIAVELGIQLCSIYGNLRLLQRLGMLEKITPSGIGHQGAVACTFVVTGADTPQIDPGYVLRAPRIAPAQTPAFQGAHNPFGWGQQ